MPGLVTVASQETILDEDETAALCGAVVAAVDALVEMRATEGERLARQIIEELGQVIAFRGLVRTEVAGNASSPS